MKNQPTKIFRIVGFLANTADWNLKATPSHATYVPRLRVKEGAEDILKKLDKHATLNRGLSEPSRHHSQLLKQ